MSICRAIVVALVGLMLFSTYRASAGAVLYSVNFDKPLSPLLRDLVTAEFSKDPELRYYLDRYDDDDRCRDPLAKFSGATAPLNPRGVLGAFIQVGGCGFGGSAGADLHIFLREQGKWKHVADTHVSGWDIKVLRRTDHGFYRLDLGWERDCDDEEGRTMETDGIMIWNGETYDRRPCQDYPDFFKGAAKTKKNKEPARR
ncbi:MAG TPA: hypothetical protein VGU20_10145 [Stellaceae bacterium]|nr:hypothetical protein [Stellaceae bacterium]